MSWLWYLYPIAGLLVARSVRIHLGRKGGVDKRQCTWRCRNAYDMWCHNCAPVKMRKTRIFLSGLFWPFLIPLGIVWCVILAVAMVAMGIKKAFEIIMASKPVRGVAAVNHWFWQDPRDRKALTGNKG